MGFRERAIVLGYDVTDIGSKKYSSKTEPIYEDTVSYLASKDNEHILYIPDDVCEISGTGNFRNIIEKLRGDLRVIGGKNLNNTRSLFVRANLRKLDLREMEADKLTLTNSMFMQARIKELYFCKAENICFMQCMFESLDCDHLDISGLTVKNVRSMERAFMFAHISNELNLNHWEETFNNAKHINNIENLFESGKFKRIDLHKLNLNRVSNNGNLFRFTQVETEIILSSDDYKAFKGSWTNRYTGDRIVTYEASKKYWFG